MSDTTQALEEPHDWLTDMIAWEDGSLGAEETIRLFQHLIDTGQAWTLQGCYGRMAATLIAAGECTR